MQYQRNTSSSSMAYSDRSISSNSSAPSAPNSPPPHLVALPSMAHSLAALPTMSALPAGMVHYSNSGTHSRAKMEYAIEKQRQYAATHPFAALNAHDTRRTPKRATIARLRHSTDDSASCYQVAIRRAEWLWD
ncbi:hypothetical protein K503DRAFT_799273 [Rhizopogon vinicolor AM-OR11-026]|uniref:Uncharacterized protein n=1 Tax=Rhizopogon vinicolor AM-OR11-026 TaxID=1314800 RepID=A0A1B7N4Z3_9AGAM|nr:hypothetical protein K503DRAFT_799273 [Rhizopogon vinicolor AM-OR11-026]